MKRLQFLKGKAKEKKNAKETAPRPPSGEPDILEETFRQFDVDGNGHLTLNEMFDAMKEIMGSKVTKAMVVKVMREIDTDGNGTIELEEFYDFFEKCDELAESGVLDNPPPELQGSPAKAEGVAPAQDGGQRATVASPAAGDSPATAYELLALMKEMKAQQETEMAALRNEVVELRKELGSLKDVTLSLKEKADKKSDKRASKAAPVAQDAAELS